MQKTVMLLDGSEAMNSSSDYLPSYLLAMRPPLLRFMTQYLDATPLASLGIVVMRNGVADRLCPCTTNASELADTLERDYFLYGGAGATSLENGLRMALSELVDLKKLASLPKGSTAAAAATTVRQQGGAAQLRVIVVSASVTFIDPTDVFRLIATMVAFRVVVEVVSLTGAVHVFDECARQTGGRLHCPLSFDHLLDIAHQLAVGRGGRRRKRFREDGDGATKRRLTSDADPRKAPMVPIGFPEYVWRKTDGSAAICFLACPQCHLIQTSIPSTCPLCRLLLCNVCLTYSTFVSHNELVPPSVEVVHGAAARKTDNSASTSTQTCRCGVCGWSCDARNGGSSPTARQCSECGIVRCADCDAFVKETIGVCPGCIAAK